MVTQLARAQGSPVIATCRREVEAEFLKGLGADHIIIVTRADYVAEVKALTGGRGVPFVFNGVGGDTLDTDLDVIALLGEIQAYGYVAGKSAFHPFRTGKTMALKTFAADDFFATPMFPAATQAMLDWFRSGPLVEPGAVLPLERAAEAHRRLDSGEVLGKIVLQP